MASEDIPIEQKLGRSEMNNWVWSKVCRETAALADRLFERIEHLEAENADLRKMLRGQ